MKYFFTSVRHTSALCFVLLTHVQGFSQGLLMERGVNGLGIEGIYARGEQTNSLGAEIGYSARGIVDFRIAAVRTSFPEEDFGDQFSSIGISPGIAVQVLKPSIEEPVALTLGAAYGFFKYIGTFLMDNHLKMKGSSLILDLELSLRIILSKSISLMPFGGFGYSFGDIKISNLNNIILETEDNNFLALSFGLPIVFSDPHSNHMRIIPQFTYSEEVFLVGISLGFIMSEPENF